MGKSLIQQKRGKGSPTYRSPGFRHIGEAKYPRYSKSSSIGKIIDIIHSQGHYSPVLDVEFDRKERCYLQAPEGVRVGDIIAIGEDAEVKPGNILPLKSIPEGTSVFNIEIRPGDGGKIVKTSGTFAKIVTKMENHVLIVLK